MELELGLALPVSSAHFPKKNFDLNTNENALLLQEQQPKDRVALKNVGLDMEFKNLMIRQKRNFAAAFGEDDENKTLSLLVWNDRQLTDEKDGNGQERKPFYPVGKNEEEDHQERGLDRANINDVRRSILVKVKMEGVVIGRKIDLTLCNSYQVLTNTLLSMFAKYRNGDKDDGPYILSYLDKEGDRLLAGDVPWQIFIKSVQRMEILKRSV